MSKATENMENIVKTRLAHVNTCLPARVDSYDPILQQCKVTPLISLLFKDGEIRELPLIEFVPVVFPSTNNSLISFPLSEGDTVMLIFSQKSLDVWNETQNTDPVNPQDYRKFDLSDAIAIPGLFSFPRAINDPSKHTLPHATTDFVVKHNIGTANENEIRLQEDGEIVFTPKTKVTVNGDMVVTGDVDVVGTVAADTDVTAGTVSLKTHTHPQANDGAGDTQSPTGVPVP